MLESGRGSLPTNPQNQPLGAKLCHEARHLWGPQLALPPPTLARGDLLISLPADPHASSTFPGHSVPAEHGHCCILTHQMGRREKCVCSSSSRSSPGRRELSQLQHRAALPGISGREHTGGLYFHLEPPPPPTLILPDQGPENSSTPTAQALLLLAELRYYWSWGPDSHSPSTPSPSLREPLDPPGPTHPQCQPRGCHCCCLHR